MDEQFKNLDFVIVVKIVKFCKYTRLLMVRLFQAHFFFLGVLMREKKKNKNFFFPNDLKLIYPRESPLKKKTKKISLVVSPFYNFRT